MEKTKTGWLSFVIAIFLIVYIIFRIIVPSGDAITTEQAIAYQASQTLSVDAYIVRDETVVNDSYDGVLSYAVSNGSHVANGGTIATVYNNEEQLNQQNHVTELKRQLNSLRSFSMQHQSSAVTDLKVMGNQIDEQLIAALNHTQTGSLETAKDDADSYFALLYRRSVILGQQGDFQEQIASLEHQIQTLEAEIGSAKSNIVAPCAGYFVSSVDGYETVLTCESMETLTPETFEKIKPKAVNHASETVGKIVNGFRWYIATEMSLDDSLQFKIGDGYNIIVPVAATDTVPTTVAYLYKDVKRQKATVVFSCSYMDSGLASARQQPVQIVLSEHSGLRISSSAVRTVDQVQGVYVREATMVKFKPIEIVYSGNGFLICKQSGDMSTGLYIYDDVIVKGKDLYDGKPLT